MTVALRKIVTCVEESRHDTGSPLDVPLRKEWVAVVIANPFSARYEPDVARLMETLNPRGLEAAAAAHGWAG